MLLSSLTCRSSKGSTLVLLPLEKNPEQFLFDNLKKTVWKMLAKKIILPASKSLTTEPVNMTDRRAAQMQNLCSALMVLFHFYVRSRQGWELPSEDSLIHCFQIREHFLDVYFAKDTFLYQVFMTSKII